MRGPNALRRNDPTQGWNARRTRARNDDARRSRARTTRGRTTREMLCSSLSSMPVRVYSVKARVDPNTTASSAPRGTARIDRCELGGKDRFGPAPHLERHNPTPRGYLSHTMTTIWRPYWLLNKHIIPVKEEVPDDDVPDVKVEPPADDDGINGEDEKTHLEGKGTKRKRATKGPCEHGVKKRSACKVCSACPHGRWRRQCKECGGKGICEHGRVRTQCKECGGSGICEHDRRRSQCKECGGGAICEHGRQRSKCKECGGGAICEHGRQRYECKECGGKGICEHGRRRDRCKECEK
jgi:hypothetical protein